MPQNVLMLLYHSLVGTYLRYGIACWGSAKTNALAKLQNLQNKVVRYITHSGPMTNIDHQYKKLNILKINEHYFQEVSKFMYRNTKKMLPAAFDRYFSQINHCHSTRTKQRSKFTLPLPRTDMGKQSIKYSGVKIWSQVPSHIKAAQSLESFSSQIKDFLIDISI